jgi:hypothetical protein
MIKLRRTRGWASAPACLAIVAAAVGSAFAQFGQNQSQQRSDEQGQSDTQYSFKQDEESTQRQQQHQQHQSQQRDQQSSQRDQQSQQRDDQSQQSQHREQQAREGEQQQWDQSREQAWPSPGRSQSGQQQNSDESQRGEFSSRSGRGQRAELGVNISTQGEQGVTVIRVRPGTAAEQMGLQRDDRITSINGRQVQSEWQFISQIQGMQPGEEIELEIVRDQEQQTITGQLQPRQQSLVRSGQRSQQDEVWQSGYEERGAESQGRSTRSGEFSSRLEQIEQQVDRLSQQIEDLRYSLRDIRQQSGLSSRETTARYDEYQGRTIESPRRQAGRWSGDTNRYGQFDGSRQRQRQFQGQQGQQGQRARDLRQGQQGQSGQRGQQSGQSERYQSDQQSGQSGQSRQSDESPGGEIGEERLRPGSEDAQR